MLAAVTSLMLVPLASQGSGAAEKMEIECLPVPRTIRCATHRGKPAKKGRALAHFADVEGTMVVRHG